MVADLSPIREASPARRRELAHEAAVIVRDRLQMVTRSIRMRRAAVDTDPQEWRAFAETARRSVDTLLALARYADGVATVLEADALTEELGEMLRGCAADRGES